MSNYPPHFTPNPLPHGIPPAPPQPGEIWQVGQTQYYPLPFELTAQAHRYSETAWNFLQGADPIRYVMIVTEPQPLPALADWQAPSANVDWQAPSANVDWQALSVMVLALESSFLSNVDLLIPSQLSGLEQAVLAETWHVPQMLQANLAQRVGHRLPRRVYDLLMTTGDVYYDPSATLPSRAEYEAAQLQIGDRLAQTDLVIQAFHQREQSWSEVLSIPFAAAQTAAASLQTTERILQAAIAVERELAIDRRQTYLNQWFDGLISSSWQAFSAIWAEGMPPLALAVRSPELSPNVSQPALSPPDPAAHPATIAALIEQLQSSPDDETLWTTMESLWRIDPDNSAAGVRQVKRIDLGLTDEPIALAVALVSKAHQKIGIRLQVYPLAGDPSQPAGFLPTHLKLVLLDPSGQVLREVVARQADRYIQLKLSGELGEAFSVKVELGDVSIAEDFVI